VTFNFLPVNQPFVGMILGIKTIWTCQLVKRQGLVNSTFNRMKYSILKRPFKKSCDFLWLTSKSQINMARRMGQTAKLFQLA
jgi:hypothetical protein